MLYLRYIQIYLRHTSDTFQIYLKHTWGPYTKYHIPCWEKQRQKNSIFHKKQSIHTPVTVCLLFVKLAYLSQRVQFLGLIFFLQCQYVWSLVGYAQELPVASRHMPYRPTWITLHVKWCVICLIIIGVIVFVCFFVMYLMYLFYLT